MTADSDFPVERGIAERYLLAHQMREERIEGLLREIDQLAIKARQADGDGKWQQATLLYVRAIHKQNEVLFLSFSIGERDPEEPEPGV